MGAVGHGRPSLRFRCHTGHAYTVDSLLSEMDEMIEDSLWNAIRALEERAMLMRRAGGDLASGAEETQRRADLVRQAVLIDDAPQVSSRA